MQDNHSAVHPPGGVKKRVRTPTVLQMEAVECGATALAIVLAHYDRYVPLEELRVACGVSRDGSKASNIVKAARSYGLEGKGFRKNPATVFDLDLPVIVFWEFNHFIVIEGYRNGKVYINDPAAGPRTLTWEEFDQGFTGVALSLKPGPEFEKGGQRPNVLAALLNRLQGSRNAMVFALLVSLMLVAPGLVIPAFLRVFIDEILIGGMQDWFSPLLIGLVLTMIFQSILTWIQQFYLTRLETKISISSSGKFFWHVLRLPVTFFTQRYAGEIGGRVQHNDQVAMMLSDQLAVAMLNLIMIFFYAVVMFQYDVLLTLIGIATAGINLGFLKLMTRRRTDANQKLILERGKMQGVAMGGIQMIETLKATGAENDFFTKWSGHQALTVNSEQRLGVSVQLLNVVPQFFLALNSALILSMGGLRVMNGSMTIGELVAFNSLIVFFLGPVNQLVNLGGSLQDMQGMLTRLDDVLKHPTDTTITDGIQDDEEAFKSKQPDQPSRAASPAAHTLTGKLTLKDICFGYSPLDPPLIKDFSIDLLPGSRVALVGASGSGKSTISRIIAGIQAPWSGELLFDGKPRSAWPRAVMNHSVAMVDQEIFLFEGSIRDNLTLWDSTIPEKDILQACRDADIHDLVVSRPGGLGGRILEGGRNLSGGQRQRLEIARTLTINPSILILDEATSALDPITEKAVDSSLRRRGCTCVIVAHRLSTIRDADEIIVMERGRIVQRGTHDSMKDADGPYLRLISQE